MKKRLRQPEVKNFRYNRLDETWFGVAGHQRFGLGPGRVKFDYGLKTYSFGLAVDEAEARHLVKILNEYTGQ
ncbi:MAG: hypothetical protein AAGI38_22335 [Bacteroidota bacterium]